MSKVTDSLLYHMALLDDGGGGGGGDTPTGTIKITTNGNHNVARYATADVEVELPNAFLPDDASSRKAFAFDEYHENFWETKIGGKYRVPVGEGHADFEIGDSVLVTGEIISGTTDAPVAYYAVWGTVSDMEDYGTPMAVIDVDGMSSRLYNGDVLEIPGDGEEYVVFGYSTAKAFTPPPMTTVTITVNDRYDVVDKGFAIVDVQGGLDKDQLVDTSIPDGYREITTTYKIARNTANNWKIGGTCNIQVPAGTAASVAVGDKIGVRYSVNGSDDLVMVAGTVSRKSTYPTYDRVLVTAEVIARSWDTLSPTITITENGTVDMRGRETAVVNVPQTPAPSGSVTITENGSHNVAQYATAVVEVPAPSGTVNITTNGNHNVSQYATAVVDVPQNVGLKWCYLLSDRTYDASVDLEDEDFPEILTQPDGFLFAPSALENNTKINKVDSTWLFQVGAYAFRGSSVSEINMQGTTSAGDGAFSDCRSLNDRLPITMDMLASLSTELFARSTVGSFTAKRAVLAGQDHFAECPALTAATIGTEVGRGRRIGTLTGTFRDCPWLKTVTLGDVTAIGARAFQNCGKLETIRFPVSTAVPTLANLDAFGGCGSELSDRTVVEVPASLVSDWEAADGWSTLVANGTIWIDPITP